MGRNAYGTLSGTSTIQRMHALLIGMFIAAAGILSQVMKGGALYRSCCRHFRSSIRLAVMLHDTL